MICPHCNKPVPYPYAEARKKARKKWRQSPKGKAWEALYSYKKYKNRAQKNRWSNYDGANRCR